MIAQFLHLVAEWSPSYDKKFQGSHHDEFLGSQGNVPKKGSTIKVAHKVLELDGIGLDWQIAIALSQLSPETTVNFVHRTVQAIVIYIYRYFFVIGWRQHV